MFFFLFLVFLGVFIFNYILLVLIINGGGSCSKALSATLNTLVQRSVSPRCLPENRTKEQANALTT
jgi:hypothetical protein